MRTTFKFTAVILSLLMLQVGSAAAGQAAKSTSSKKTSNPKILIHKPASDVAVLKSEVLGVGGSSKPTPKGSVSKVSAATTLSTILSTTFSSLVGKTIPFASFYEYNVSTCAAMPSTVTTLTAPTKGSLTVTSEMRPLPPGSGSCSGVMSTFTIISYTRSSPVGAGATDTFSVQWQTADGLYDYTINGTAQLAPEMPVRADGKPLKEPGAVCCGDPISVGTGNVFESETDYTTVGANPLQFIRYYNSRIGTTNAVSLANNWRHNFDRSLNLISGTSVTAERADGSLVAFTLTGGVWTTTTDNDIKLTNVGSTWTLTDSDDTVETYTTSGAKAILNTIRLRNGYTQTMAYTSGKLTSVTDTYSRTLTLTYSGTLLQTVTAPSGLVLTYAYQISGVTPGVADRLGSVSYSTTPISNQTYRYEIAILPFALTSIVDENNNLYKQWDYDTVYRGIASQVGTGANAVLTNFVYDDTTNDRTVTNGLGQPEVYKFTTLQGVPKLTQIDRTATATTAAATRLFTYDANGYTASATDWNGNLTSYVNNVRGQPTTITEPSRTTTIAYDTTWLHLPKTITTPGVTTTFTYDGNGQVLTKTLTDTTTTTVPYVTTGEVRTWTYTWLNSLLKTVQNPRTDVVAKTTFGYAADGALTSSSNALSQLTSITTHTAGGLPTTVVDPNSVTTTLAYDTRQRLLNSNITMAAGVRTTSYIYDKAEQRTQVTLPDNSAVGWGYDSAHRVYEMADLLNNRQTYALNALGGSTQTQNLLNTTVTRNQTATYDALGRVKTTTGGASQLTSYTYDNMGNVLTVTDPLTHVTTNTYDTLNRLSTITDPGNSVGTGLTTITYDAHDRPLTVTDARSNVTSYVYNGFGDVIQKTSPDTGTTVYRYDPDSNLKQMVDANGITTNYTYDALDRPLTVAYPASATENVTYTYDQAGHGKGVGRLTTVADAAGSLSLSYDERGSITSQDRTRSAVTRTTGYTYEAAGRLASITYPSTTVINYTRNIMGQITGAKLGASVFLSNVTYLPFGPLGGMKYANNITDSRSFDLDNRLLTILDKTPSVTQQNLTYGYDNADNVTSITDTLTPANNQAFTYDPSDRLLTASGVYGSLTYTYDKVGNRLSSKLGAAAAVPYTIPSTSNRLSSVGAQTLTTDANGNITAYSPALPSGITNQTYNNANRLSSVKTGATTTASYLYDAFGQRTLKTVGANSTWYTYDPAGHLIEEDTGAGVAGKTYVYLDNLPIVVIDEVAGTFNYVHSSNLGTPQKITSGAAATIWTANYQPFGAVTPTGTFSQNLRYPGQYFDAESGLNQNGFRDYLPTFGRYVQSDPIGLNGGINTYGYVGSNPLKWTDPSGECPACVAAESIVIAAARGYRFGEMVANLTHLPAAVPLLNEGAGDNAGDNANASNEGGSCSPGDPNGEKPNKPKRVKTPNEAEPNSTYVNPNGKQIRRYGPKGQPEYDIDYGHGHHEGGSPHGHNWDGKQRGPSVPVSPVPWY